MTEQEKKTLTVLLSQIADGRVRWDLDEPAVEPGFFRKHLTIERVLLLVMALFQAGQSFGVFTTQQLSTNTTIASSISAIETRLTAAEQVYMRRDVIDERLKAIDGRLTSIESAIRTRNNQ